MMGEVDVRASLTSPIHAEHGFAMTGEVGWTREAREPGEGLERQ